MDPLAKKLGIRFGHRIGMIAAPDSFTQWLATIDGWEGAEEELDILISFHQSMSDLDQIAELIPLIKRTGMYWVAWPKKSSGIKTDINRDIIREYVLGLGLVDVKVASIDETWSSLKFVYRLIDR